MKTVDIQSIAKAAGRDLTAKGNLELGSNDQGKHGPPGGSIRFAAVTYYLLSTGDYRVVIDDRSGSNQGYFEQHRGDKTVMDGADMDEVQQLAKEHIESIEDSDLLRAWRIASAEARATLRAAARGAGSAAPGV